VNQIYFEFKSIDLHRRSIFKACSRTWRQTTWIASVATIVIINLTGTCQSTAITRTALLTSRTVGLILAVLLICRSTRKDKRRNKKSLRKRKETCKYWQRKFDRIFSIEWPLTPVTFDCALHFSLEIRKLDCMIWIQDINTTLAINVSSDSSSTISSCFGAVGHTMDTNYTVSILCGLFKYTRLPKAIFIVDDWYSERMICLSKELEENTALEMNNVSVVSISWTLP
jgi:hypothetical protein